MPYLDRDGTETSQQIRGIIYNAVGRIAILAAFPAIERKNVPRNYQSNPRGASNA
jgi:hypothetical protein